MRLKYFTWLFCILVVFLGPVVYGLYVLTSLAHNATHSNQVFAPKQLNSSQSILPSTIASSISGFTSSKTITEGSGLKFTPDYMDGEMLFETGGVESSSAKGVQLPIPSFTNTKLSTLQHQVYDFNYNPQGSSHNQYSVGSSGVLPLPDVLVDSDKK